VLYSVAYTIIRPIYVNKKSAYTDFYLISSMRLFVGTLSLLSSPKLWASRRPLVLWWSLRVWAVRLQLLSRCTQVRSSYRGKRVRLTLDIKMVYNLSKLLLVIGGWWQVRDCSRKFADFTRC